MRFVEVCYFAFAKNLVRVAIATVRCKFSLSTGPTALDCAWPVKVFKRVTIALSCEKLLAVHASRVHPRIAALARSVQA